MRKAINWIIAILAMGIAIILAFRTEAPAIWKAVAVVFSLIHVIAAVKKEKRQTDRPADAAAHRAVLPRTALTELVLLGEENDRLASWNIYGKSGLVIGRDVGENNVSVNLENSVYASMIDVEHAVLNYSGGNWYIEDISEKNGVSIQKQDGRKYKLTYGKPCKLEKGDIICIALARLQIL